MNQSPLDRYQNLARAAVRRNKLYLLDKIELRYLTQYIDSRFPDPMGFRAVRLQRTEQGLRVLWAERRRTVVNSAIFKSDINGHFDDEDDEDFDEMGEVNK